MIETKYTILEAEPEENIHAFCEKVAQYACKKLTQKTYAIFNNVKIEINEDDSADRIRSKLIWKSLE